MNIRQGPLVRLGMLQESEQSREGLCVSCLSLASVQFAGGQSSHLQSDRLPLIQGVGVKGPYTGGSQHMAGAS